MHEIPVSADRRTLSWVLTVETNESGCRILPAVGRILAEERVRYNQSRNDLQILNHAVARMTVSVAREHRILGRAMERRSQTMMGKSAVQL